MTYVHNVKHLSRDKVFSYLDDLRRWEPEGVEVRQQRLVGVLRLPELRHDGGVGGAPAGVDQEELGVGGAVNGNKVADEDLVRGVLRIYNLIVRKLQKYRFLMLCTVSLFQVTT